MFTFYSKKKLQEAVMAGIKRIDDALALQDLTQRAEALIAAKEETRKSHGDLHGSIIKKGLPSFLGLAFLGVAGVAMVASGFPVILGTVGIFLVLTGGAAGVKSRFDLDAVTNKIEPLTKKCNAEISTIFTQDQDSFMKTSIGKELSEDFQKDLSDQFGTAAAKKNKTDLEYALLKENTGNPAPKA